MVSGTSGEGSLLSVNERKTLAEHWIQAGKGRFQHIIIQVGTDSLRETKDMAKHAEEHGATGIAVLPTVYFPPKSPDVLASYLQQVSAAAPKTPLFYYHIPAASHTTFPLEEILAAANHRVPTLAGAKSSSPDQCDLGRCLRLEEGKFDILFAGDGMILGALAMGGTGFVGLTFNYAGRCVNRMIEAFNGGDILTARKEQWHLQDLFHVTRLHGSGNTYDVGVHKAIISLCGLDLGPPCPPNIALNDTQTAGLRSDLEGIGFFEWCS